MTTTVARARARVGGDGDDDADADARDAGDDVTRTRDLRARNASVMMTTPAVLTFPRAW